MPENMANIELALQLGINNEDYSRIKTSLARNPNYTELCLISALWLNKSLNTNFRELFTDLKNNNKSVDNPLELLQSTIKLNENTSCYMSIGSNDLPFISGLYPESSYCLASAGRNVISAGAYPVAILNTFRFGLPELASTKKSAEDFLIGVGEVGNSLGYPIVGAKISFERCFNDNPEFNTLVVGLLDNSNILSLNNNIVDYEVYMVSDEIKTDFYINEKICSKEDIQNIIRKTAIDAVSGLSEKKLHESTLEAIKTNGISAIEAVGKNGLLHSLHNLARKLKLGFTIDFNKILASNNIYNGFAALFSGQFANLILIIEKGKEKPIEKIFEKWELKFKQIGHINEKETIVITSGSKVVAEIPEKLLRNDFDIILSNPIKSKLKSDVKAELDDLILPDKMKDVAWFMIKHPNIASKKWINEQYDSMAGISNMSTNFISDAVLINLQGTNNALALCMTGNENHFKANPYTGAQIAVAAACRKIVCSGAKPLAILPSISFLDFKDSKDCTTFNEYTSGLFDAAKKFGLSISNENIKVKTQSDFTGYSQVHCPSLTVGMLGYLEDKNQQMTISFKNKGNIIFVIGPSKEEISASEYLVSYHKKDIEHAPFFDLELEKNVQAAIYELIKKKYICSAHSITRGGLFISLVESARIFGFGFDIITDTDIRLDAFLFGESQGRVLVSINPNKENLFIDFMMKKEIPFLALGHVTKGEMRIDDISYGFIEDAKRVYENSLEKIIYSSI
jgi:phosphoribosylformylglycinamidine synthase